MNSLQRFKEILLGLLLIFYALVIMYDRDYPQLLIVSTICLYLIFDGIRKMVYYVKMARHMVGGKRILIRSILTLDLGLFTLMMTSMSDLTILIYLLSFFAFTGVISILRSIESKKNGGHWKLKMIEGVMYIVYSVVLIVAGMFTNQKELLVQSFSGTLLCFGVLRIYSAFRKTKIIYIQ